MDEATVSHIIKVLGEKGTDYWWTGPVEEFIPKHLDGQILQKGTDTLDVWFDSGSSWTMLEQLRTEEPLAEVYLEGSDQHRGWFQSSLLTKLSTSHIDTQAPYGSIISHGMVMDEDGQKMSKSAGNGLSPVDVTMGTKVNHSRLKSLTARRNLVKVLTHYEFGPHRSTTQEMSLLDQMPSSMLPSPCGKSEVQCVSCWLTLPAKRSKASRRYRQDL